MPGYTILVADDSKSMRQLIDFTLQGAGYRVVSAEDGVQAMEMMKGQKIDLVVTDFNMPNLDGMGVLKQLREDAATKSIPVVMLTTEAEMDKVVEAKNAGINGWIIKPFEPTKLTSTVKELLP